MTTYSHAKPAGTPTWLDLMTPDIDAARTFYRAVLGWDYDGGNDEFGGYIMARVGDRLVAGMMGQQPDESPTAAAWSTYFATNDIEADVARAVKHGATVVYQPMAVGDFGSMAVCNDPTGAAFSFWQAATHTGSQVVAEPGAAAWYELYSPNAQQARDFYTAILRASADSMAGGMEYYVLKHGDQELAGIMQIDPSWGAFPAQWMTYFLVEDIDKAAAAIAAHGGKLVSAIDDSPFGRMAAAVDPSGATFKIVEGSAA